MNRFEIGETVFFATFSAHTSVYVECPDCGGTGRLRVIFHDGEEVSIDCQNCALGYNPPSGRVLVYKNKADVEERVITGMEIDGEEVRYKSRHHEGYYNTLDADRVFNSREEAEVKADELHKEFVAEQEARIFKKEKDAKSWAWNASYHRNQIKDAQKHIEYHTRKLNAANLKVKK